MKRKDLRDVIRRKYEAGCIAMNIFRDLNAALGLTAIKKEG